jgi:flagella basal body P-ring formation protein FlgA
MRPILILTAGIALASAQCIPVTRDHFSAGDLARVLPVFQAIDPETPAGFSPAPGLQRALAANELMRFAEDHGLSLGSEALPRVCVQREAKPIRLDELKAALAAAVAIDGAVIDVIEYSLQPVPEGHLDFSLSGLDRVAASTPEAPVIWRGRLIYDGARSIGVWAKVRIRVPQPWIVTRLPISAGSAIRADQVAEMTSRPFPFPSGAALATADVIGKIARQNFRIGQLLLESALEEEREVNRGDRVQVRVTDGSAVVSFEAEAQTSGASGDTVLVKNPSSGRNFPARVEGVGLVSVRRLAREPR